MQLTSGARPAAHLGSRARQTPGGNRDDRPGTVQRGGVVVGDPHGPASRRGVAGDGDVTAQPDQNPTSSRGRGRPRRPIGGQRLRGCAEIELDARRNADRAVIRVELDGSPTGDGLKARPEASPVTEQHLRERAVIAGPTDVRPEGRVDEPARALRNRKSDRHREEEQRADLDPLTGEPVQLAQLGVRPEAAAGVVECLQLCLQDFSSLGKRGRVRGRDDGGRPESAKSLRRDHDPPETATGGAVLCVGAWTDGTAGGGEDKCNDGGAGAAGTGTFVTVVRVVGCRAVVVVEALRPDAALLT